MQNKETMTERSGLDTSKLADLETIRRQFPGNDCPAQRQRFLEAMGRYPITTVEASRYLDVYYPPARVMELRNEGHAIKTHWATVVTESGQKHRVGLYALEGLK